MSVPGGSVSWVGSVRVKGLHLRCPEKRLKGNA